MKITKTLQPVYSAKSRTYSMNHSRIEQNKACSRAKTYPVPRMRLHIHTVKDSPPFRISEEGWGEFDMNITLTAHEKGGDHSITHDLNFQSNKYEAKHTLVSLCPMHIFR